ncbi:MAG: hypothetical protein JRH15_15910 [Deltaproteobacteria bacterium]|nr:hypothetical protein [Deltaproteobacteria bacterium]
MAKAKVLYMFTDETADSSTHRAVIDTPNVSITAIGVSSTEEAAKIAKEHVEEKGFHLIELCGASGYAGGKAVHDAVGKKVPVGIIVHQFDNSPNICKLLEKFEL